MRISERWAWFLCSILGLVLCVVIGAAWGNGWEHQMNWPAMICVVGAVVGTFALLGTGGLLLSDSMLARQRRDNPGRLKAAFARAQNGKVTIYCDFPTADHPLARGSFDPDDEDAITDALAKASDEADSYNEKVRAAETLAATVNRGVTA